MEDELGEEGVVPIAALLPADSPRIAGVDQEHLRSLAEAATPLPPILVHRSSMRVVDGMHRLEAAVLRGEHEIAVEFFDGSEQLAFLHAVRANLTHGLPLSRADREAATIRIITSHPDWSDRMIASSTGLSDKTVAAIRRRSTTQAVQVTARVGTDGRVRPLNSSEGRQRAAEIIAARPDASLREVARASGIALGTVRDVKERLRRGEDPVPVRRRPNGVPQSRMRVVEPPDPLETLQVLRRDPSLRFTDAGRHTLRWLDLHVISTGDWGGVVGGLPTHCTNVVADLARRCAAVWQELADELEQRDQFSA
ncbi:streptomycin biosynthesis protein [Lentzea alba]|uniref:streptomycin biosynthesis protein n=1 Tax=Lentzea alba TaxID=2714351 RepID=UPI0039BF4FBE